MIFYIHFILFTSGLSGTSVLLGVFMKHYSDASQGEIGVLLMTFPFMFFVIKPLFCSLADRHQAHRNYLVGALVVMLIGFAPFIAIPYFPMFYTQTPRYSWYLLVASSYVGNGGLAVAWSLGESLAINSTQKTNTPYGRLRLFGTVSWGVYGYIIGQINEIPIVPKFVPAFLILELSVILEIILILLWNKEAFVMIDPTQLQEINKLESGSNNNKNNKNHHDNLTEQQQQQQLKAAAYQLDIDSTPSSLGGTLRMKPKAAMAIRDLVLLEDLTKRLNKSIDSPDGNNNYQSEKSNTLGSLKRCDSSFSNNSHQLQVAAAAAAATTTNNKLSDCELASPQAGDKRDGNPQIIIFRLIMAEDGRLIKYLVLYTMVGFLLSPLNFVFLSFDDVCMDGRCNFSELAGSVLISQAASETFCFLVLPWILVKIRRSVAIVLALTVLSGRFFFYAGFYYTGNISPYWALIGEWGHGVGYAICATILADIALMFASQSRLFIPEMRRLGFVSDIGANGGEIDEAKILAEENSIKMALRATMQAVFGAVMDGLGNGVGSLVCGCVVEAYSYVRLWQLMTTVAVGTAIVYQITELTKSKWSDSFKPRQGSKAFEIRTMENNDKANKV